MAALFYHLTRSPAESLLPVLIDRSLKAGWRVAVRGTRPDRLAWLDERLWLEPEDGFLPHGLLGGEWDAAQPVLLTPGPVTNGARCLMCIDGAEAEPEEAATLDRVCILFDGTDPGAVEGARGQWRRLTGAGVSAQYWSEESGRWEKKAES
ncbi:DNA polymerase III subunit chi [Haematobacter missouriensis]|uniref:DNA polymerase III subunit chi n=1 Tax=Haematobacter missouriensis TaxID=366616 RepID=A0A212AX58_9RHOB|nr:DNA polymerase III subunit chi [Haematobacter missouriensis]KFI34078.1 DNA polymerase III subunit chi [Haematobacter missouriensis]OWJ78318.1 DNA polymerase III subunit chi [Haematobacter missouriensis]OWJ86067.1 DNA polymerase III subunit chi [Haematobacter missouriensis]